MHSFLKYFKPFLSLSLLIGSSHLFAFEPFYIHDIRVEGLKRIDIGTVYNYLPLQKGERLDKFSSSDAIRTLYKTGFFKEINLEQDGNDLIIHLSERPAIASIELTGGAKADRDMLKENLKGLGFAEGRIFNQGLMDRVSQQLKMQHYSQGKYNANVSVDVEPLERNRVAVKLNIEAGDVAAIHRFKIIGNKAYSDDLLNGIIESGQKPLIPLFDSQAEYSKQKLAADLESIRSHYMDNGYLKFNIESTQVSITPDRKDVYITINLDEGEQYKVKDVAITGNTILPKSDLMQLVTVEKGKFFSRKQVIETSQLITEKLGDIGYAFANINPIPEIDEETKDVSLTYMVDAGERVYVRRININGHKTTKDEVLRREFRQMEAGWISTAQIKRSQTRLNRLGFFEDVSVSTPQVQGTNDQVDVDVTVKERDSFGTFNAGMGYGNTTGLNLSASINWENFLGTGKKYTLEVNNSDVNRVYRFSQFDPYFTLDGISQNFNIAMTTTDSTQANTTQYTTDNYNISYNLGIPISEFDTLKIGAEAERTVINIDTGTSSYIQTYCSTYASLTDCKFDAVKISGSISHDTRNRAIFPTDGSSTTFSGNISLPMGADYQTFYKLNINRKSYYPLSDSITFSTFADLAYAAVYGDSSELLPYERYYTGGMRSVRGYQSNSLGATGTLDSNGLPIGGDTRVLASAELIVPPPFTGQDNSMRMGVFIDAGNVFDSDSGYDMSELRYSAGLSMMWITPIGPLKFSFSKPMNNKPTDIVESFQFTIGTI